MSCGGQLGRFNRYWLTAYLGVLGFFPLSRKMYFWIQTVLFHPHYEFHYPLPPSYIPLENFKPHIHLLTFSPNQTDSLLLRFFNNGLSESHFPTFQLLVQTSPTLPPQHPCLQLHSLPPSFFSCVPYPICLLVSFPHSSTSGATVWTD